MGATAWACDCMIVPIDVVELPGQCRALGTLGVEFVLHLTHLEGTETVVDDLRLGIDLRAEGIELRVGVARQGVGLIERCELAFVALALDGGADIAAAGGHLRKHLCVAGLHGIDDLLRREARLCLDVAQSGLNLLYGTVERRCELVDGGAVSLNGIHQQLTPCVAVQLGGKIRESVSATAEATPSVAAPESPEQDHPHPLPAVAIAVAVIAVVSVHQRGHEVAVHCATVVEH